MVVVTEVGLVGDSLARVGWGVAGVVTGTAAEMGLGLPLESTATTCVSQQGNTVHMSTVCFKRRSRPLRLRSKQMHEWALACSFQALTVAA